MSTNAEEQAVINYLVANRGLDRVAAANSLHMGLANHWFANAEPELKRLVLAYRNTMGRDGRRKGAVESVG